MAKNQPAAEAPAADATEEVTIARGTYVVGPEEEYGPGSKVTVPKSEAKRLKVLGFVRPDDYLAPQEVQDGQLKISSGEGPQVTGG